MAGDYINYKCLSFCNNFED